MHSFLFSLSTLEPLIPPNQHSTLNNSTSAKPTIQHSKFKTQHCRRHCLRHGFAPQAQAYSIIPALPTT